MPISSFLGGAYVDDRAAITVDVGGNAYIGGAIGSSFSSQQALLARISKQLTLTVTDANGQLVQGLTLKNGWPTLNAAGGAVANPLTVTATFVNQATQIQDLSVQLNITSPNTPARFWAWAGSTLECGLAGTVTNGGNAHSFQAYQQTCAAAQVPANAARTFVWKVWVQPSLATELRFNARLIGPGITLLNEQTAPLVTVEQANIRPIVIMPGFFGTLWRNTSTNGISTSDLVLDPLNNTYEGLLRQLRILGYEDQTTIATFAYAWYTFTIEQVSDQLNQHIATWWNGKTRPAYVHATEFDIIAHSTGGLITRKYVDKYGASRLHDVFFVATPQQGAPMAFGALEGLDPQNALPSSPTFESNTADTIMRSMVRSLAKKAGCFTERLSPYGKYSFSVPDEKLYTYMKGLACTTTTILPTGNTTQVTGPAQPGVPVFSELLPSTAAVSNYLNGSYLHGQLGYTPPVSPTSATLNALNTSTRVNAFVQGIASDGGHIFTLYSSTLKTVGAYGVQNNPIAAPTPLWLNGAATPIGWDKTLPLEERRTAQGYLLGTGTLGTGDFVVPAWSANLLSLVDPNSPYLSSIKTISLENVYGNQGAVSHAWYFKDQTRALKQIVGHLIIPDATVNWLNDLPLIEPVDPNYPGIIGTLLFENYCPVTMLITDPQGHRIGTTPAGIDLNEVNHGIYTGHSTGNQPDLLWFTPTTSGTYTITITGRAAAPYQVRGRMLETAGETPVGLWTGTLQPGQSVTSTFTVLPNQPRPILLIDDHTSAVVLPYYQTALQQLGIAAIIWNVSQQGIPQPTDLMSYDRAIWVDGTTTGLNTEALLSIGAYLDLGGSLLLTGQDVDATTGTTNLFTETLHTTIPSTTTTSQTLVGSDLLAGIPMVLNGSNSANNQTTPSVLTPLSGATPLATYQNGSTPAGTAALRFANGQGRLVYLGFGIEGIQTAATRATVLEHLLGWLDPRQSHPTSPPTLGLVNGSFEQGLTGWSPLPMSGTIGASSIALDGANSTAITGQVLLDQVVTGLVPNTQYTLSAWVQAANGPDNPVWVWISEYGGATLFQGAVDTQGWEQLTHVFQTGATNTRVRIRIQTPTLDGQALVDHIQLTGPLAPPPPDPPPGTMPGLLEAEDAPSFFDTDMINEGGVYRSDGLDVETCTVCLRTGSDGYNVGWIAAGEWLEFPVTFAASGSYKVRVRYTTPDTGQSLRVKLNGVDVTGQLALPQTGGWGNWQDVTGPSFSANAGTATIRIELLSDMVSLDMIEIIPAGS